MYAPNLTPSNGTHLWSAATCRRFPKRLSLARAQATAAPSEKRRRVAALQSRAGMTLTELLVVVAIMVILIGMAVPMMRNGLEERKLREASRQLNTAFALAKAMAAETGRAAGVWIDAQSGTSYAQQVFLAEMPAPYAGDVVGATATVYIVSSAVAKVVFHPNKTSPLQPLLQVGDQIKFECKGPWYPITAISQSVYPPPVPSPALTLDIDISGVPAPPTPFPQPPPLPSPAPPPPPLPPPPAPALPPPPSLAYALPYGLFSYQIARRPIKSSSMPLELPAGAVIDVGCSGYGLADICFLANKSHLASPAYDTFKTSPVTDPITVMFNPDGSVERVWIWNSLCRPVTPSETMHFLVGKIEQTNEDTNSPRPQNSIVSTPWHFNTNLTDPTTLWVSIAPKAGRVTTAENGWQLRPNPPTVVYFDDSMAAAREFAQSGQTVGGR
ncbi:MAG: prepilin-type N-terminal cleavage/methylation domain-containing protein [Planctomycetota bacterium]|nr:prepilin-type N-terminal cleavage/methylation domain-containing protein [Planctomycetota bacterium]